MAQSVNGESKRSKANQFVADGLHEWDKNEILPYYPIRVEDIKGYTSKSVYEEKYLKTILTMGKVTSDSEKWGEITTLTCGKPDRFPVNFDSLDLDVLYTTDSTGAWSSVWEKYCAFKLLGTLEPLNGRIVLKVDRFVPVQDIILTMELMPFFSHIGHYTYEQHGNELDDNNNFKDYWETLKLKGMRCE